MRILSGLKDHPREARGISLRVSLRRAAHGPPSSSEGGGRYRLESLRELDPATALEFRPALRSDVVLEAERALVGPFVIEIDAFEHALLERCDGRLALGDAAIAAASDLDDGGPADPIGPALELLSALAKFDALIAGEQR